MTNDMSAISEDIVEEAIGWMLASREGMNAEEQAALEQWLDTDARHRRAWERLDGSLNPFRIIEAQPVTGRQLVASIAKRRISRRTMIGNGAAGALALAASIGVADRISPLGGMLADYSTATGQRRAFPLPDGSTLTLDARSEANQSARSKDRGIDLLKGTAVVEASIDAKPFIMTNRNVEAALNDGSLMVSNRDDACRFICLKGHTDLVLSGNHRISLSPLEGILVSSGGLRTLSLNETRDSASWTEGKLILHDRPLKDVIDAFRPYRAGILSVSAEAARLRVSGIFSLDRLQDVLDMIQEIFPVRVLHISPLFTRIDIP